MGSFSCIFRFSRLALVPFLGLAALGCESRGTDEARRFSPPPPAIAAGTHVDFALLNERVLTPYCTACHGEFGTEEGLLLFVKPGDPGGSALYLDMAQGTMPPGGPAASDPLLEIVRNYITGK